MVSGKTVATIAAVVGAGALGIYLLTRQAGAVATGSLSGAVLNASTNLPIAGATVEAVGRSTTTDANGDWVLTGLPPGPVTVTVSAPGFSGTTRTTTVVAGSDVPIGDVSLTPTTQVGEVFGIVRDASTLNRLEGAVVSIAGQTQTTPLIGLFDFFNVPVGTYVLTIGRNGYGTVTRTVVVSAGTNDLGYIDLTPTIQTGNAIGLVLDNTTSMPVAGATVAIGPYTGLTDASGGFGIGNITPGAYTLTVVANGYQTYSASVNIVSGGNDLGVIRLTPTAPTTGSVAGRAVDSTTLAPISGASVSMAGQIATSDVNGNFAMTGIAAGTYPLTVSATGYQTASRSVTVIGGQQTSMGDILTSLGDISLTPIAPLTLSISATPLSGPAPLTVGFEALPSGVSPYSFQWSFGDGGTSVFQNPGYTYASPGTYTAVCTVTDALSRTAQDSVVITVTSGTGGASGRAVDSSTGIPISGATVSLAGQNTSTDVNGNFAFAGIAPGTYTLTISRTGYVSVSRAVTILAGQVT